METFWLLGHEKLQSNENLSPNQVEEVFESVFEPEFLQIIWNLKLCRSKFAIMFQCWNEVNLMIYVIEYEAI